MTLSEGQTVRCVDAALAEHILNEGAEYTIDAADDLGFVVLGELTPDETGGPQWWVSDRFEAIP